MSRCRNQQKAASAANDSAPHPGTSAVITELLYAAIISPQTSQLV